MMSNNPVQLSPVAKRRLRRCTQGLCTLLVACLTGILSSPHNAKAQDLTRIGQEKPINFYGGFEMRSIFYQASGMTNRRQPFSYLLSGSPTLSIYGMSVPLSFAFSKEEKSFQQPFNQFGLSPRYKWITAHAGYRNVYFSPYTLSGHTMLGGGVELNPGKLRLGVMYGRLNRAAVIDTLTQSLVPYSFDRKGFAAKLGVGTARNHFDLHFLSARDDSTSRPFLPNMAGRNQVFAAANTVLGYGTKWSFLKGFTFESDGAVSLYTRDLNSPIQFEDIQDPTLNRLKNLLDVNGSSEWFLAFRAGLGYTRQHYGLKLEFRRVEPDFKSMGSYFFANDIQNLTIAPHFSLPNGRLRFNGSLGLERDNVNLQKQSTSTRIIGSAVVSSELTQRLGLDLNYSNYSNNQQPNTLMMADSLKIVQTTQTLSLMPRYLIPGTTISHMILASVNFNGMKDYNSYFGSDAPSRDVFTRQYMLNYNLTFPQKMLSLYANINYTGLETHGLETSYRGVSFGGNYRFAKQKLNAGLNNSIMSGKQATGQSMIFNSSANLSYQINRSQGLRFALFLTKNNPGSVITGMNPSFTETRGELAYQINLGL